MGDNGVAIEVVEIPAGWFWMGTNRGSLHEAGLEWCENHRNEMPYHQVYLPEYCIAKHPVTNTQFLAFIQNGGYEDAAFWTEAGWRWKQTARRIQPPYMADDRYSAPSQPVIGVTWYEAAAFCSWLGVTWSGQCRLPSEAEWEKAARGTDGRLWPWGNEWSADRCCSWDAGVHRTAVVGAYSPQGDSAYGVADMSGNVGEWTRSVWGTLPHEADFPYPYDPADGREEPDAPGRRVVRGGSFDDDPEFVRCAHRDWGNVDFGGCQGFRVVSDNPD